MLYVTTWFRYGKGFGIIGPLLGKDHVLNKPNSLLGILFYSFMASIGNFKGIKQSLMYPKINYFIGHSDSQMINYIALIATILSNCASVYFAYILVFVLHDLCIVCVSIYIINFINLLLLYSKVCQTRSIKRKEKAQ